MSRLPLNDVAVVRVRHQMGVEVTWHSNDEWEQITKAVESDDEENDDGLHDLANYYELHSIEEAEETRERMLAPECRAHCRMNVAAIIKNAILSEAN